MLADRRGVTPVRWARDAELRWRSRSSQAFVCQLSSKADTRATRGPAVLFRALRT
jgi:hypothetical protein